jgi:hypothetical protein
VARTIVSKSVVSGIVPSPFRCARGELNSRRGEPSFVRDDDQLCAVACAEFGHRATAPRPANRTKHGYATARYLTAELLEFPDARVVGRYCHAGWSRAFVDDAPDVGRR